MGSLYMLVMLHFFSMNSTRKLGKEPLVRELNQFEQQLTGLRSKGALESARYIQNWLFVIYLPLESWRFVQDLD